MALLWIGNQDTLRMLDAEIWEKKVPFVPNFIALFECRMRGTFVSKVLCDNTAKLRTKGTKNCLRTQQDLT